MYNKLEKLYQGIWQINKCHLFIKNVVSENIIKNFFCSEYE